MSGLGVLRRKKYTDLSLDLSEAMRYAGADKLAAPDELLLSCLTEYGQMEGRIVFRGCSIERFSDGSMDLGFAQVGSFALARNLAGCSRLVLFAGTIGIRTDRLIARYSRISPAKALWFQAMGAAGVEALCDRFCEDMRQEFGPCKPRFSPGFGDFGLDMQPAIFRALDCERSIGLTLNDSWLMSPSKSVTALIGIKDEDNEVEDEY